MATVTLNGEPLNVAGNFPRVGDRAASFMLVGKDLRDVSLSQFAGKRKVLSIVPSVDTPVCAESTRKFNQLATSIPNTVVLTISADLPFAQNRFCGAEGIKNIVLLSSMRGRDFAKSYGVMITDPPLSGLMARALIVLDENDTVVYAELVSAIEKEPNYQGALDVLMPTAA